MSHPFDSCTPQQIADYYYRMAKIVEVESVGLVAALAETQRPNAGITLRSIPACRTLLQQDEQFLIGQAGGITPSAPTVAYQPIFQRSTIISVHDLRTAHGANDA
ncbi:MAG: hypothetical protein LBU43_05805 [Candidatus Accumulibacter sp.]|nr:hypothetical protein [Accumulibacter sp.]